MEIHAGKGRMASVCCLARAPNILKPFISAHLLFYLFSLSCVNKQCCYAVGQINRKLACILGYRVFLFCALAQSIFLCWYWKRSGLHQIMLPFATLEFYCHIIYDTQENNFPEFIICRSAITIFIIVPLLKQRNRAS